MSSTSSKTSVTELKTTVRQSRTDWARVDALADEDIDTSDIPAMTGEDFARSEWRFPAAAPSSIPAVSTVLVEVAVDEDTLTWFQAQGQEYPQKMQAALRIYAEAHRS